MELSDQLEELGVVITPRRKTYRQLCNDMKQREILDQRANCDVKGTKKQVEAKRKRLLRKADERGVRYESGGRAKEIAIAEEFGLDPEEVDPFGLPDVPTFEYLLQSIIEATPEPQLSAEELEQRRQQRLVQQEQQRQAREVQRAAAIKEAEERAEQQRILRQQQAEQLRLQQQKQVELQKEQAEQLRLQKEKQAEQLRLQQEQQAEQLRIEKERQVQEAERLRIEKEAERIRLHQEQKAKEAEAERIRLQQEQEAKEVEAERFRLQQEQEVKEAEAERLRLQQEQQKAAQAQRQAEETRLEEERVAEAQRQVQEAERLQAEEAERLQAEEERAKQEALTAEKLEKERKAAEFKARTEAEYKAMQEREKRERDEKFEREMAELEKKKQAILAAGLAAEEKKQQEEKTTTPSPSSDTYSVLSIKDKAIQLQIPLNAEYPLTLVLWLTKIDEGIPHGFGQQTKLLNSAPENNIFTFTLNPDSDVSYLAQQGNIAITDRSKHITDIFFDAGGKNVRIVTHCDGMQKTLTNPSNAAGTSCFADSVVVSLFAIRDSIIDQQFLEKQPVDLECDSKLDPDKASKVKIDLVKALRNYVNVIRSPPDEGDFKTQVCLNVRRLVAQCRPTFKDVGPTKAGQFSVADSTEFWNGLAAVFNVTPMRVKVSKFSSADDVKKYLQKKTVPKLKDILQKKGLNVQGKKGDFVDRLTPVLVKETKRSETREQGTVSVTQDMEGNRVSHILQEKHIPEDSPPYTRVTEIVAADFLVFDLGRYDYSEQGKLIWSDQKYEFTPNIRLASGQSYQLKSFVALAGAESFKKGQVLGVGHYVAYVRCDKNQWLKFDDLAGPEPQFLPQRPAVQLEKASVLAFYTKQ